jgi:hypothetical protein
LRKNFITQKHSFMKQIFTATILFVSLAGGAGRLSAQAPVLVNTMTPFPAGTTDSIYSATATVAPGSGGAGVTWNLSALVPSALGMVTIVTPSSTPYYSTFPTSTFSAQISPNSGGSMYVYERLSATKWEQLANNYAGTGTGTDYTPNPESAIEFPMNYLDIFTDTFQKTTGSSGTVDISYDGYGTLVTPFGTYSNVVRIKKYWGPGDYDNNWYVTSPNLGIVASFHAQSNSYTLVRPIGTTSVKNIAADARVQLYPNPFQDAVTIKLNAVSTLRDASIIITDVAGRIVQQSPLLSSETTISANGLCHGIYFYQLFNDGARIANGKLVKQ